MRHLALAVVGLLLALPADLALGQDATPSTVVSPPNDPSAPPTPDYEELRRQELQRKARRSRNALIGTGAAAAFGLALVIPAGATQCETFTRADGKEDYECTKLGRALLGVGAPFVAGGLTGVVITGIMLGVRKGKLRRMNDGTGYPSTRAVRWDERRSVFVF